MVWVLSTNWEAIMKLGDIDWDSAPYGSEKLAQFGVLVAWLKEGHYYRVSDDSWACANTKDFEVLATRPKPQLTIMKDIDWSKVHPVYEYLVLDTKARHIECCTKEHYDQFRDDLVILAKRPNPPLTDEQIEAVREFCEWANGCDGLVDTWLKQRGGEQ